ncbi:MAG: hypothetical protein V1772_04800, partial [Chloroflexota bacterium]
MSDAFQTTLRAHRNQQLFSDYYLDNRAPQRPEWRQASLAADASDAFAALRALWLAKRGGLPSANEAVTEDVWIRPVLKVLGHHYTVAVALATPYGAKTPDYVLCPDEPTRQRLQTLGRPAAEADLHGATGAAGAKAAADAPGAADAPAVAAALGVADAKRWDRPLDQRGAEPAPDALSASPSYQIDFYMRHGGVAWGLLTNGRLWRLYHRDSSHRNDYYEVDLPALLEAADAEQFKYFWLFFRREAFVPSVGAAAGGPAGWLDLVRAESASYAQGVSESLKTQVYHALRALAQGFLDYPANRLAPEPAALKDIYDNSLIVLYRLLFVLYAEARGLLPVEVNVAYRESYSLRALARRAARDEDAHHPAVASVDDLWTQLRRLWRTIDGGNPDMGVPAYNGGLFAPKEHPFLERYAVGDAPLRYALDQLARAADPHTGARHFVDYRDLEIRHLGSIYEGLLEYRLVGPGGPTPSPSPPAGRGAGSAGASSPSPRAGRAGEGAAPTRAGGGAV